MSIASGLSHLAVNVFRKLCKERFFAGDSEGSSGSLRRWIELYPQGTNL